MALRTAAARIAVGLAASGVMVVLASAADAKTRALCVHGLAAGATLAMRTAPNATAQVISELAAGACGLTTVGRCTGDWCEMAHGGAKGWVDTRFVGIYEFPGEAQAFVTPTTPVVKLPAGSPPAFQAPLPRRPQTPAPVGSDQAESAKPTPGAEAKRQQPEQKTASASASGSKAAHARAPDAPPKAPRGVVKQARSGDRDRHEEAREAREARRVPYRAVLSYSVEPWPWRGSRFAIPYPRPIFGERVARMVDQPGYAGAFGRRDQGRLGHGHCVSRVARRDTLRIRSGPGGGHEQIGEIPPDACRVEPTGSCRGDWCRIAWRGRVGWVNSYYLE